MKILCPTSRFPHLNTTFILDEMLELESQGEVIAIARALPPKYSLDELHSRYSALAAPIWSLSLIGLMVGAALGGLRRPKAAAQALFRLVLATGLRPIPLLKAIYGFTVGTAYSRRAENAEIDWIHAHFATLPTTVAWTLHRLLAVPFSFTGQGFDVFVNASASLANPSLRLKMRDASFVVATSDFMAEHLRAIEPGTEIQVIPNGIRVEEIRSTARSASTPRVGGDLSIISVGSYVPKKGHDTLIRAFGLLVDMGIDARLQIVGPGPRWRYEALVEELELGDLVSLCGPMSQEEILPRVKAADVFALACRVSETGDMDGTPSVIKEALALERPVVSTVTSGIPELVRTNETGILVEPDDPVALAGAFKSLYEDPSLRARLGGAGHDAVREGHAITHNVRRLRACIRDHDRA